MDCDCPELNNYEKALKEKGHSLPDVAVWRVQSKLKKFEEQPEMDVSNEDCVEKLLTNWLKDPDQTMSEDELREKAAKVCHEEPGEEGEPEEGEADNKEADKFQLGEDEEEEEAETKKFQFGDDDDKEAKGFQFDDEDDEKETEAFGCKDEEKFDFGFSVDPFRKGGPDLEGREPDSETKECIDRLMNQGLSYEEAELKCADTFRETGIVDYELGPFDGFDEEEEKFGWGWRRFKKKKKKKDGDAKEDESKKEASKDKEEKE